MTETDPDVDLRIGRPKRAAAGLRGVAVSVRRAVSEMGIRKSARTLLELNQTDGFDCMSCAWPDPGAADRHTAEFCENGAKAVAWEGTRVRLRPAFFAQHSIADLLERTEHWLGDQGRLTEPMVKRAGGTHYEPIGWDAAFALIGATLRGLSSPDEALFYTSGRTSNEAAFLYQLFARAYGTNNLPDCSNMCHESTSLALAETIGIGKGTVSLDDVHNADLVVLSGQNPGTNHPRMLAALEKAKRNGARIVAVNPLREAGLVKFDNPQNARGLSGIGTPLTDLFLQVRLGGDLALWRAVGHLMLEVEARDPGRVVDTEFVSDHTTGFQAYADHVRELDWDAVLTATGLTRGEIEQLATELITSERTVHCWAMGITQHVAAVDTIAEFVNIALLRGMIGKPGAGLCPVRGHSNVQGDRTMGVWSKSPPWFLDALQAEFGFDPPRAHGHNSVGAVRALRARKAKVFIGLGGNFTSAMSDTAVTEAAMRGAQLTVHVSTKLNRSHLVTGRTALILPTLGRSERDTSGGREQVVTVEDSMSAVHASRGRAEPAGQELRSEVAIVCGIATATLGDRHGIPWREFAADYGAIRTRISRVVPGFAGYDEKIAAPGGFVLPHGPRDSRTFPTASGKAVFTVSPLPPNDVPPGHLALQTLRSHDQFNTTVYGLDDRYRGVYGGRRVVFVNPQDLADLGFADGDVVDLVGTEIGGVTRRAAQFRTIAYDTPRGSAAAYYPETNPLVPLESVALRSETPASKWVVIRLVDPRRG